MKNIKYWFKRWYHIIHGGGGFLTVWFENPSAYVPGNIVNYKDQVYLVLGPHPQYAGATMLKIKQIKAVILDSDTIRLPIVEAKSSAQYPLILVDSIGVTHYFNFDGTYDGFGMDCKL